MEQTVMEKEIFGVLSDRVSSEERLEAEKQRFANMLKKDIGKEMLEVLSEKKAVDAKPKKTNKFKEFLKRIARICQ